MPSCIAPKVDDEIAEAVDDGGILAEARCAVDVAEGTNPLRYASSSPSSRFREARIERAVTRAAS